MREMTYMVPLVEQYKITNFGSTGDTLDEDAFRYDRIYAGIARDEKLTADIEFDQLFSVVSASRPDVSIDQRDIVPALEGKLSEWCLCMARVDGDGLEIVLLHDCEVENYPTVTCKLNPAKSKIQIGFKTKNGECDVQNRYFYREICKEDVAGKTQRSISVIEEYDRTYTSSRHIHFKKAADGVSTNLLITDYRP